MQVLRKPGEAKDRGDECYDQGNSHKIAGEEEACRTRWSFHVRSLTEALKAALERIEGAAEVAPCQVSFTWNSWLYRAAREVTKRFKVATRHRW